jgi:phosphoribosyl-ATP pyrophosphohydrolase
MAKDPIARLHEVVLSKRGGDPNSSYTAKLLDGGRAVIARKVGEEAVETVIEIMRGERHGVIAESADLLYHLVVAWVDLDIEPAEIWAELERREAIGGLAEKAARKGE